MKMISPYGVELWVSDGTESGTTMTRDTDTTESSDTLYLTALNGFLFFAADDGTTGIEPWVSDGSASGTELLIDINDGSGGSIDD